ncbi:hypothetical protein E2I00_013845, partial [Balaenoptera physalus]
MVLFAIFLTLYLLTLLENTLIISLVCSPVHPPGLHDLRPLCGRLPPTHYLLLLRPQICLGLALSSWLGGLLVSVVKISCVASLSYCGPNVLNQFFCDVSPLLNLSCTHVTLTELLLWPRMRPSGGLCSKCLRLLPAAKPSTCASHLIVVDIFCSVLLFTYSRPSRVEPTDLNKLL